MGSHCCKDESKQEAKEIDDYNQNTYGNTYPVMIRFNPHIMGGGNYNISTGHIDSKFGISIHQLRHVLRIVKTTHLNVEGLHMHTGSEIKDIEVFRVLFKD